MLYTAGSVPLYLSLPYFAGDTSSSMASLLGFYGSSLLLISFFGGAYRYGAGHRPGRGGRGIKKGSPKERERRREKHAFPHTPTVPCVFRVQHNARL